MTELDAYNRMLATLGESPVESENEDHGSLPAARAQLSRTRQAVLGKGWWFNRENTTLTPDPESGYVSVPTDALSVEVVASNLKYAQRGSRLYDSTNGTYVIPYAVAVRLLRDLEFTDLPFIAQEYIAAEAVAQFNIDNEGDPLKLREAQAVAKRAWFALFGEDLRQAKPNILNRASTAVKINRIVGTSGRFYSR